MEGLLQAADLGVSSIQDRVSLAVEPREIVVLIGPNGSGKTTLIKALPGLMRHEGTVRLKPGLRIGYVPQHFLRDTSLPITAGRFLALYGGDARTAVARVGCEGLASHQLATLSGGEMARILLARTIARQRST